MSKQLAMVEVLESRSLMSAAVPVATLPVAYSNVMPTTTAAAVKKAAKPAPKPKVVFTPSDLVRDWDGKVTIKAFPFKLKYDLELSITEVGDKTAEGTITIDDKDYSGHWTGRTQKNGWFSYTLKKHGDKVTITGTINAKKTYAWGTVKVDWDWRKYNSDFTMTKNT